MVRQADGTLKEVDKRGFFTKKEALAWLADAQSAGRKGEYVEPSRLRFGTYGAEVIKRSAHRPTDQGVVRQELAASHRGVPIADLPLAQLTGQRLTAHYRVLETAGRKDHRAGEGLSPRTVRYLHTIIHGVLVQAGRDSLLLRNPANAARPPTAKEARAPEMHPWDAGQLAAFLAWAEGNTGNYPLWNTLAMTGMRRGEALALRWRDMDLDANSVSIRRSAGMVRHAGEGAGVVEGDTKSGGAPVLEARAPWRSSSSPRTLSSSATSRGGTAIPSTPAGSSPATWSAAGRYPRSGFTTCATLTPRCSCWPASRCTWSASASATPRRW
jgi:integrase